MTADPYAHLDDNMVAAMSVVTVVADRVEQVAELVSDGMTVEDAFLASAAAEVYLKHATEGR